MPHVNGLFMVTKLSEINPKLNVIIMCDFAIEM
jgi:YesN/AraC family two-component response regulator